jgi:hypothetical protein
MTLHEYKTNEKLNKRNKKQTNIYIYVYGVQNIEIRRIPTIGFFLLINNPIS